MALERAVGKFLRRFVRQKRKAFAERLDGPILCPHFAFGLVERKQFENFAPTVTLAAVAEFEKIRMGQRAEFCTIAAHLRLEDQRFQFPENCQKRFRLGH